MRRVLCLLGIFLIAIYRLSQAESLPPGYREALRALEQGQLQKGETLLEEIISSYPSFGPAYYYLARSLYFARHNPNRARELVQKALDLGLDKTETRRAQFVLNWMAGKEWKRILGSGGATAEVETFLSQWPFWEEILIARRYLAARLADDIVKNPDREAAERYLSRFGDLPEADRVQNTAYELQLADLRDKKNETALRTFLEEMRGTPMEERISAVIEELALEEALKRGDQQALREFLTSPLGQSHRERIEDRLGELAYNELLESPTEAGAREFLGRFPDHPMTPPARDLLIRLQFDRVLEEETIEGYQDFLDQFPEAPQADVVRQNLSFLRNEFFAEVQGHRVTIKVKAAEAEPVGWIKPEVTFLPQLTVTVTNQGPGGLNELYLRGTIQEASGEVMVVKEVPVFGPFVPPLREKETSAPVEISFSEGSPSKGEDLVFIIVVEAGLNPLEEDWIRLGVLRLVGKTAGEKDVPLTLKPLPRDAESPTPQAGFPPPDF